MVAIRRLFLTAGIAIGVATAPASAAVLTTAPLWSTASNGDHIDCAAVNVSSTPLSSISKVEILDGAGTVLVSSSLAGLDPGKVAVIRDYSGGYEWCRFTASSAKKIRGTINVLYNDGSKYVLRATQEAR